jgi:hypothetical protein
VGGRDCFRTGHTGLVQEVGARERGQRGEEEKHAANLGAPLARPQIEPSDIRDGCRHGAGRVGAFLVSTAGEPCTPFCLQEERDGYRAQAVSLGLEGLAESIHREVLLPQRDDLGTDRSTFRSTVRTVVRWEKEGAVGVWAERVAEHAETPGRSAQPLGDLLRGETCHKVCPECLVLPMGGVGWFQEDTWQLCKGFSCIAKPRATLLCILERWVLQGRHILIEEEDRCQ